MTNSHKQKTLVIGGGGYIGQHLLPLLLTSGREVTVLSRRATTNLGKLQNVRYVDGDFGNLSQISSLLDTHGEIIHLAYATVPNTSYDNPLGDLLENLPVTVQLFSEIAKRNKKLLLVSSGGTVYGEVENVPIKESQATQPISPYGLTKLTIENYARLYSVTKGLKFICVRPANAYGVGQKPFAGQGFVSTALASALMGKTVKIYGQPGTTRDYIYVSDIASGILSALEKGVLNETYNIGTAIGLSNFELMLKANAILEPIGKCAKIEHVAARKFDVSQNVLDSTKLRDHTGWSPGVDLDEGLKLTLNWLKLNYS